jgi:hypothetical protein
MMTDERRNLTEPLESVTAFFGLLLLIALVGGVVLALFGTGTYGGFGPFSGGCATQQGITYGSSGWTWPSDTGIAARPGISSISVSGTLVACADHPGVADRILNSLTELPAVVLWAGILLLLWRMIRAARRSGPFTAQVASGMRRLGWFILAGSLLAAGIQRLAQYELLGQLVTGAPSGLPIVVLGSLRALVPGPALTGAALLTFARITGHGADMDDELQGTV